MTSKDRYFALHDFTLFHNPFAGFTPISQRPQWRPSAHRTVLTGSHANVALNSTQSATAMVDNILRVGVNLNATALDEAFIEKKLMSISAATTVVPTPGAFWLFGSALTGVLVSRRRNIPA